MFIFDRTVIRNAGPLERERWEFTMIDNGLFLKEWVRETRPTTRHRKWTKLEDWARICRRGTRKPEPVVPGDVILEALNAARQAIVFKRWPL